MSIISAHRLFGMSTVVTFMAALFALPSDAQLQCGAEYDRIAAKMASSSGEVTDSEISFALDCERAAAHSPTRCRIASATARNRRHVARIVRAVLLSQS